MCPIDCSARNVLLCRVKVKVTVANERFLLGAFFEDRCLHLRNDEAIKVWSAHTLRIHCLSQEMVMVLQPTGR